MEDMLEQANEIQESLGRSYGLGDDIDDADLEAELDMLGEGEFDMEDASYLDDATSAPAAPTAIPSDGAVADTSKVAVDEFGLPGTLA